MKTLMERHALIKSASQLGQVHPEPVVVNITNLIQDLSGDTERA